MGKQKPGIIAIQVTSSHSGRGNPLPSGAPSGCGEQQRQIVPMADIHILTTDGCQSCPTRLMIDQGGIHHMLVKGYSG
jgi:hypothetical protein